jgi:hypothetical protein
LVVDANQQVFRLEVADREPERLADAKPARKQVFEQQPVLLGVGVLD